MRITWRTRRSRELRRVLAKNAPLLAWPAAGEERGTQIGFDDLFSCASLQAPVTVNQRDHVLRRFSGDRWDLILNLIGSDDQSVLDIGCRDRALSRFLPPRSSYVGFDLTPPADVIGTAEQPLSFEDDSFDTVVLADVLEHLNDPHAALQEAIRVARSAVVVVLPNVYSLYHRLRFVTGMMPGDKYLFGPEPRADRHRWLLNFHQALSFTHGLARSAGWVVARQYAYDRPFRRPLARMGYWLARVLGSPNVWAWEYAARLEPLRAAVR